MYVNFMLAELIFDSKMNGPCHVTIDVIQLSHLGLLEDSSTPLLGIGGASCTILVVRTDPQRLYSYWHNTNILQNVWTKHNGPRDSGQT